MDDAYQPARHLKASSRRRILIDCDRADWRVWFMAVGLASILLYLPAEGAEPKVEARHYGGKIVAPPSMLGNGGKLTPAVTDLQSYLKQMVGAEYALSKENAGSAIVLSLASSPDATAAVVARLKGKGLEAFVIQGDSARLQITANDWRGLSHGVYFYLEQLGVRWLMAGANWTIVPARRDITLTINRLEAPAFWARSWAGTGGFYSNLFGRQYTGSADRQKGIVDSETDVNAWMRRLRLGGQYLGHHMGEAFVSDPTITPILAAHPEYLAKIDGKHASLYELAANGQYILDATKKRFRRAVKPEVGTHNLNVLVKLNAGNPAAVNLYAQWILRNLRNARKASGGYAIQTMSVEPSDGGGDGNNYKELRAQGVGDGSEGDQAFFISNACARLVRKEFPDVSVVMLAYNTRSDPPTFSLEPNLIVQPAMAMRHGRKTARLTTDAWLTAWATKASNMAIYTYWSIPDWTHDEPTFNYLDVARKLRDYYSKNIKGINAESTWSGGAMGLAQYVAAHVMWDPKLDERALIEEWYDKAFGPAKAPMKRMLERWAIGFRLFRPELASTYRDLGEAMRLAKGDAAVAARVDDYVRYVHYLRLRLELLNATDKAERDRRAGTLAEYVFDIHESRMVHTIRAFDLLAFRGFPALQKEFYLHGNNTLPGDSPDGPGWARVRPLSHSEVAALVADGLRRYPPPDFAMRKYTGKLVPLTPLKWSAPKGDPWGVIYGGVGDLDVDVTIPPRLKKLPLRVSRFVGNVVTVLDAAGHVVFRHTVTVPKNGAPGANMALLTTWDKLDIPLAPGHYRLHLKPTGGRAQGYFNMQTWRGVPFIIGKFLSSKGLTAVPTLYFYVPRGTPKVVLYLPETGDFDGNITPKFFDSQGNPVPVERRENGKLILATVPAGQDGKVWSVHRVCCPDERMETLTVPQAFSFDPQLLMVPKDALQSKATTLGGN